MDITVHNVELSVLGKHQVFVMSLEITNGDGPDQHLACIAPTDVFETRAAEYDIDMSTDKGWDDVLHVVFYERYLDDDPDEQLADPDNLFNAPTVAEARKALLNRVKTRRGAGKLRGSVGEPITHRSILNNATMLTRTSDTDDPIQFIKNTAPMSNDHIMVKKEFTRRRRNGIRARRRGRNTREMIDESTEQARRDMKMDRNFGRESAEELADQLLGPDNPETRTPPNLSPREQ
jgi:hypothetical protein